MKYPRPLDEGLGIALCDLWILLHFAAGRHSELEVVPGWDNMYAQPVLKISRSLRITSCRENGLPPKLLLLLEAVN